MKQYILATKNENQEQAVYIATNLLRGDAAIWWRHHYKYLTREELAIPDWKEFEKMLIRKFKPVNGTKTVRDQLARLRQTGFVKTYNTVFTSIILEISTISKEEQLDR